MARYIGLDDAVRTGLDMCVKVAGHGLSPIVAMDIVDAFEAIPTADVVEVVRCKDCEFRIVAEDIPEFRGRPAMMCGRTFRITGEDEYCKYGIRRDDEDD